MNPEFQRNLWLEASPRRLAWAGVTLALIYGATWVLASHAQTTVFRDGQWVRAGFPAFQVIGGLVFLGAGLIWGARAASRGLNEEVLGRTWAFQRASSLSPWEMTWGKLFGATSLAWIAALTGLLAVALPVWRESGPRLAAAVLLWGASLAMLLQALSLSAALVGGRKARAEVRLYSGRFGLGGLVSFLLLIWAFSHLFPMSGGDEHARGASLQPAIFFLDLDRQPIRWWDHDQPRIWFITGSMMAFAAWAVTAAWRLMRLELQMRNSPWIWAGFVLFAGLYAAGFVSGDQTGGRFVAAGVVFAACAYLAAFAEPADRVRLKLWAGAVRRLDLWRTMMDAPAVIAPVKLALLAVIGAALSPAIPLATNHIEELTPNHGLYLFAGFVFLLRDLGVIAYFRFAPRTGGRGDFGAVVALALIYFIGVTAAKAVGGPAGQALFLPTSGQEPLSLIAALVEAAAIWTLAFGRIQALQRRA